MSVFPRLLTVSAAVVALSLVCGGAEAAKKEVPAPALDGPTVGVFGASRGHSYEADGTRRPSAPPAPVVATPQPKVEAETPTIPLSTTAAPSSLPAAPRPDAQVEGGAAGAPSALPAPLAPSPNTGFLATHPYASGLVAGLIGTQLGSLLYGGTMMGDEGAVTIGFIVRVGVILLMAGLFLSWVARRMTAKEDDPLAGLPSGRREPTFDRPTAGPGGRREPFLGNGPNSDKAKDSAPALAAHDRGGLRARRP